MNLRKRKGFTLIELIVVMAIIAILVLLAAPKYLNYTKDAHVTAMQQDAKVLSNIALGYNVKNDGVYPVIKSGDTVNDANGDPISETVTLSVIDGEVTLDIVKEALDNTTLTEAQLGNFNPELVKGSLQGLKNNLGDYVIVIDGPNEGEVVYLAGILTNSDGNRYVSVSPMEVKVEEVTP